MKQVGFTGPFGDSNFGDYAMFVNNVLTIGAKEISVFTYHKKFAEDLTNKYLKHYNVRLIEPLVRQEEQDQRPSSKKFQIIYTKSDETVSEIESQIVNFSEIEKEVGKLSVLIVSGGGFLNHLWCARHRKFRLLKILAPILAAQKTGVRTVFMGNTYGPFTDCDLFFSGLFSYLTDVTLAARDQYSINCLKKIGVLREVALVPDDLYFPADDFLKINIEEPNLSENYAVLELYLSMEELEWGLEEIRRLVDCYRESYHMEVVFLPFDVGYGGVMQGAFLKKNIPELHIVALEKWGYLPYELCKNIIRRARFVLCNRYHAFVMALSNNIPCYMYIRQVHGSRDYYYRKVKGLLDLIFFEQNYTEEKFFAMTLEEFLKNSEQMPKDLSVYQRGFYNEKKREAEKKWYLVRNCYISQNVKEATYAISTRV